MSRAEHADPPAHDIHVHKRAMAELEQLRGEFDIGDLEARIRAAAREREPRKHPTVDGLEGDDRLLKVRGDGVRAVCSLVSPYLLVLLVDKRRRVYDRLPVALARLDDWDGGN